MRQDIRWINHISDFMYVYRLGTNVKLKSNGGGWVLVQYVIIGDEDES